MNGPATLIPRKRVGRPPKSLKAKADANSNATPGSFGAKEDYLVMPTTDIDGSVEQTSTAVCASSDTTAATSVYLGSSECRRSSRKKVTKFEVLDVLHKNRKTHKIQIEARIDSNVPAIQPFSSTVQNDQAAGTSCAAIISAADLSSKQKTFIEKSAIFRRYSISTEQQNKINSVPSVVNESSLVNDVEMAKITQARHLSRTQEIFNASMQKSKQNSSLIIAQMENISCCSTAKKIQRKANFFDVNRRKIAAKIPKSKHLKADANVRDDQETASTLSAPPKVQKRRGRPPKNKPKDVESFTIAQNTPEKHVLHQENRTENKPTEESECSIYKEVITPQKAKNWQEYKACLKVFESQPQSNSIATQRCVPQSEVILEISSSESESESDALQLSPTNGATKQRNFAAVSFLHEISSSVNDNVTAPEFIVASVEEILTEPTTVDSCESASLQLQHQHFKDHEITYEIATERAAVEKPKIETTITTSNVASPKRLGVSSSSSSESETNSDRSQNRVYKHGDKLRVSLKRLSTQELSPHKGAKIASASSATCSSSSSPNRDILGGLSKREKKQTTRKRAKSLKKPKKPAVNPHAKSKLKEVQIAPFIVSEEKSTQSKVRKEEYAGYSMYSNVEDNSDKQNYQNRNELQNIRNFELEQNKNEKELFLENAEMRELITTNVDDENIKAEQIKVKTKRIQQKGASVSMDLISIEKGNEREIAEEDHEDEDKRMYIELYEEFIEKEEEGEQDLKERSKNDNYSDIVEEIEVDQLSTNEIILEEHEVWVPKAVKEINEINDQEEIETNEKDSDTYFLRATSDQTENESLKLTNEQLEELVEEDIVQQPIHSANLLPESTDIFKKNIKRNDKLNTEFAEISEQKGISNKMPIEGLTEVIIAQEDSKETEYTENTGNVEADSSDLNQNYAEEQNMILMQESDFMNVLNMNTNESDQTDGKIEFPSSNEETIYEESMVIPAVGKEEIVETITAAFEEPSKEVQVDADVSTGMQPQLSKEISVEPQPHTSAEIPKTMRKTKEIRLPPKKQLKNLNIVNDTSHSTELQPSVAQITDNVNVETKTLLDILKSVHCNETAATSNPAEGKTSPISSNNSPGTTSPQSFAVKRATAVRRYERRRRCGEEEVLPKTLEETFAEIAAQSSKEILEMFTICNEFSQAESQSEVEMNLENAAIVEESIEKRSSECETKIDNEEESTNTTQYKAIVSEIDCKGIAENPNENVADNNAQEREQNIEIKSIMDEVLSASAKAIDEPSETMVSPEPKKQNKQKNGPNKNEFGAKVPLKRGRKPKAKVKETVQAVVERPNEDVAHSLITDPPENINEEFKKSAEEIVTRGEEDSFQFTTENKPRTAENINIIEKVEKSECDQNEKDDINISVNSEKPSVVTLDSLQEEKIDLEIPGENLKIQDVQKERDKLRLSPQISNPIETQKPVEQFEIPNKAEQPTEVYNAIENTAILSGEIKDIIKEGEETKKDQNEYANLAGKSPLVIREEMKEYAAKIPTVEKVIPPKSEVSEIEKLQKEAKIPDETTNAIQSKPIQIAPPKKRYLKAQMSAEQNMVTSSIKSDNQVTTETNTPKKKVQKNTKATNISKKEVLTAAEKKTTPTSISKRGPKSKHKPTTETQNAESTASPAAAKKTSKKLIEDIANPRSVESSPKSLDKKTKKSDKKKIAESEIDANGKKIPVEEKPVKKKRQRKLKEALDAVEMEKSTVTETQKNDVPDNEAAVAPNDTNTLTGENSSTKCNILSPQIPSPLPNVPLKSFETDKITPLPYEPVEATTDTVPACIAISTAEPDEDPDPLKDIEKFIADGVNLLKRGYKVGDDDDSTDGTVLNAAKKLIKEDLARTPTKEDSGPALQSTDIAAISSFTLTPADTPIATPSVTPPPKSPVSLEISPRLLLDIDPYDLAGGVRRSDRIKQNSKTPKALVGRGLVRDKERFSLKDDVETKTHYTINDHRMDLAEVEAKNAKFLKDMEERLSNFRVIKENEYKCERVVSKEAKKMICDCFLTADEEGRGELACGEDCLNRLLMIECGPDCNIKERCANKRFQKFLCSPCRVFRTEKKGFGLLADIEILPGEFIMEYVGEVINDDEFERRRIVYSLDKNRHYYFMALRSDAIIDATNKGNVSRFINHSCDPNAETQKWTVNGELRIGFFSRKSIMPGEEITFDYQYQRYGREAQRCYCEAANCRGWIGEEPNSDEGEQLDEDSEGDEEEEENLAERLLADDDDDESDETEADAEEAQKKLEIAAAEAKLTPITEDYKKEILESAEMKKKKADSDSDGKRNSVEEDSKSKFKKLLSKMAEKVAKNKKQKATQRKKRNRQKGGEGNGTSGKLLKSRYLEDPDIDDEVSFLSRCGLKNQSDTLRLSRLVVRAKLVQTRLNLLKILRSGDMPCRRLFLDYHGLRLLHGWISEDGGDLDIRLALLETLESLPIPNKTMLTDSKVYQAVRSWCSNGPITASVGNSLSPSDESSKESTTSLVKTSNPVQQEVPVELKNLALKLTASWDSLPEIFRIPKRERIEQMKEHEREADRQYAVTAARDEDGRRSSSSNSDRYQRDRFSRNGAAGSSSHRFAWSRAGSGAGGSKEPRNISVLGSNTDPRRRGNGIDLHQSSSEATKHLSKEQRREMFAAKVARDEAEKRLAEERREFDAKCRFFGLDPKTTRPQSLPFFVDPISGQWYTADRQPVPTPPSHSHAILPGREIVTNPANYRLPAAAANLPHKWKFAITPQGKIYYYHMQFRIPQWDPPTYAQMYGNQEGGATTPDSASESGANDSTDDNDEIIKGMEPSKLEAYVEEKVGMRRQERYGRLVDQRSISPRREEDRVFNQMEMRKYKENKEKIRKRKEEIRRRRLEALKKSTLNMCTLGTIDEKTADAADTSQSSKVSSEEPVVTIQEYLLSSDEEDVKAECTNSPLIDKIVQGDKIVDELDALTAKKALKRPLPPHRELPNALTSTATAAATATTAPIIEKLEHHKKRKLDKRESSKSVKKSKDQESKYRKLKEKFRCEIAGIIVQHLKPYRKDTCVIGHIRSNEDFNHLAKKLTHFVMIKELRYCESVGQTLVVTESVKSKSREFIKKYMAKYSDGYVKSGNDPEFKDIPFSLQI